MEEPETTRWARQDLPVRPILPVSSPCRNIVDVNPLWNPAAKSASIRKWADRLHKEAKRVFLQDKAHAHFVFAFLDSGPMSITPVPPKTPQDRTHNAIITAIRQNNLYGIIDVGEAWTYFPKSDKDHTAFLLLDGEKRVSDLRDGDRTEALYLRMESRDGDCVVYLNRIVREGNKVGLGEYRTISDEELQWFSGPRKA
jgi:hypothetical protein